PIALQHRVIVITERSLSLCVHRRRLVIGSRVEDSSPSLLSSSLFSSPSPLSSIFSSPLPSSSLFVTVKLTRGLSVPSS
ncbi:hypothetical protein S245_012653, partial [Arachis hypogaea]